VSVESSPDGDLVLNAEGSRSIVCNNPLSASCQAGSLGERFSRLENSVEAFRIIRSDTAPAGPPGLFRAAPDSFAFSSFFLQASPNVVVNEPTKTELRVVVGGYYLGDECIIFFSIVF